MIYNFKDFVTKIDENVNSAEFLNKFGLTEEEDATAADAPVEDAPEDAPVADDAADLEAFKKEHLDVMFNELSSDDFDAFYSSEFKEWKEMEDGEEKEAKKEEILTKIKDMFQLGEKEEAPAEDEPVAEEPVEENAQADIEAKAAAAVETELNAIDEEDPDPTKLGEILDKVEGFLLKGGLPKNLQRFQRKLAKMFRKHPMQQKYKHLSMECPKW